MLPSGAKCQEVDCCVSELVLGKSK